MSEAQARASVRKNSFWLLISRVGAQGLAVIFTALAARKLELGEYGHFAFIASLLVLGNTFTNFGTDTFLIRETARANSVTESAARALSLQLILSMLYCAAMLALRDSSLLIYSLALFPLAVFAVNNALLRALNRMDLFWALSFANGLVQIVAVYFSSDILSLCINLLFGQMLVSLASLWISRASLPSFRLFPLIDFRPIFKSTLPFAALTFLIVLTQKLGVLAVAYFLDDASTGLFSSAARVVEGLKFGHYAILGALLPALARRAPQARQSFRRAFLLLLFISLTFALALSLFSRPIISLIFGEQFLSATIPLSILGWCLIPYTISSFISYALIARELEYTVVNAALASVIFHIALYQILIPSLGILGAAWAALLGETLQALVFAAFFFLPQKPLLQKQS